MQKDNRDMVKSNEQTKKVYILDTTVLIDNPRLPYELTDGDVVIPVSVLRELDGLKNSDTLAVSRAARTVSRFLERLGSYGDLKFGVKLSTGVFVRVCPFFEAVDLLASEGDNRVLGAALYLKKEGFDNIVLVSTDVNMRVAAGLLGFSVSMGTGSGGRESGERSVVWLDKGGRYVGPDLTGGGIVPLVGVAMMWFFIRGHGTFLSAAAGIIALVCFAFTVIGAFLGDGKGGSHRGDGGGGSSGRSHSADPPIYLDTFPGNDAPLPYPRPRRRR